MHGISLKPLSALVCCVCMGATGAFAGETGGQLSPALNMDRLREKEGDGAANFVAPVDDAAPVLAPKGKAGGDDPALQLKVERKMAPIGTDKTDTHPVFIVADQIEGRKDESTVAEGNVQLRKLGNSLQADKLIYAPLEDEVEAMGHVRFEHASDVVTGPYLRLRLAEKVGYMDQPTYVLHSQSHPRGWGELANAPVLAGLELAPLKPRVVEGYGEAERIEFEGENQTQITKGTYSTCKPTERDWYARAEKIHLDFDFNRGKGEAATLYFKDTPILYAPVMTFALNNQPTSGFLAPTWGSSTRSGFDFSLPYYWNIAPNYDAILMPRVLTKRGVQLGSEFNYLDYYYNGSAKLEVLPRDSEYGAKRFAYSLNHNHLNLGRGFSGAINWSGVSDDTYWTDLSSRLVQTSQVNLTRQVVLNYGSGSWWNVSSQVLRYQTLQPDKANPIARPYFLEPQVNFNARLPDLKGTDLSFAGQYTSFSHPTDVQGQRFVAYPQVALPMVQPGYYLTPKIGVHGTQYTLNQQTAGGPTSISRSVPILSVDAGMTFERDIKWAGRDFTQTLEPRLFYVNVPHREQGNIPIFDTGVADFNFAQIFSENRYVGNDRISDANQLTAAVTTRVIDPATGGERFKAMFGQRYYYRPQRVTMTGEVAREDRFSNMLAAFTGSIVPKTYVDMAIEYDQNSNRTERFSIGGRYQPERGKVFSTSYRMTRGQLEQVDVAGQWPVSGRWYAVARYNYSFRDKNLVEAIGGFEYKAGCWVSRFVAQRLQSVGGLPTTNFFYQLELNDFAQIGTNPISLLRRSVPGYSQINDANDVSDNGLLSSE